MFLGTFEPKLLANGQVSLPSKIRGALGQDRAIITTGFDKCIYGFSVEDWQRITDEELQKPLSTVEGRQVRQRMFAAALEVDFDSQGRFVIPENLKKFAGISETLIIIGAGDHFEIWDRQEWSQYSAQMS